MAGNVISHILPFIKAIQCWGRESQLAVVVSVSPTVALSNYIVTWFYFSESNLTREEPTSNVFCGQLNGHILIRVNFQNVQLWSTNFWSIRWVESSINQTALMSIYWLDSNTHFLQLEQLLLSLLLLPVAPAARRLSTAQTSLKSEAERSTERHLASILYFWEESPPR